MSLVEPEPGDLYIDHVFDAKQRYIWTADQLPSESLEWVVDFSDGSCHWSNFHLYTASVRAVRSAQSS